MKASEVLCFKLNDGILLELQFFALFQKLFHHNTSAYMVETLNYV